MFNFTENRKSISDIYQMFKNENLIVDESYQRRSVWGEKDKIRLIETILLNLVIPELFFWKATTDPETGESVTHIVDGQQRIKAIYSFIDNEYKLNSKFLLDNNIKLNYGDKFFRDFSSDEKKAFWNYNLMVIDIDSNATRTDIINMFNRLNLTDYNLNDQEKRNSKSGEFSSLAIEIAEDEFWDNRRLFTNADIKRMKDVEFCATIILLYKNGIIDQTDQTALNKAYEEFQTNYKNAEEDKNAVLNAIDIINNSFCSEAVLKFLRKKAQLYTLFSLVFYMQRENIKKSDSVVDNFNKFVGLYSKFNNKMDFNIDLDDDEKKLVDFLKRYKLASSEGLNKHTNRMIRFEVMKFFVFNITEAQKQKINVLQEKLENCFSQEQINEDPDEY